MSLQKGTVGVAWSTSVGATASGMGTFVGQSADYTRGGEEKKIRGLDGVTVNRTFFDGLEKLTLEVIPTGATVALANTASVLPARGTDVAITDTTGSPLIGTGEVDGTGFWMFLEGTIKKSTDNEIRLTFQLERSEKYLKTIVAA